MEYEINTCVLMKLTVFIFYFFYSRGNRHPLPPSLAQNVNSARQREEKGLDGAPS